MTEKIDGLQWQDLVTDVDAFYNEETCPNIQGKLVSITNMELAGRDTEVAVVVLTAPAKGVKGKGDNKEEVNLEPGEAIGVVVKHKLQDLYSMLPNQCYVDITAKEKIKVPSGTMWRYKVRWAGQRVLTPARRSESAGSAGSSGSAPKDPEKEAEKAFQAI